MAQSGQGQSKRGLRLHHRRSGQRRLCVGETGSPSPDAIASCCSRPAPTEPPHPWLHIPLGYGKLLHRQAATTGCYETEPQPECHNRNVIAPRGKVLGGSSSINGLIYIRGQAEDFNHWRQLGNTGWGFDDVLPYFRKIGGATSAAADAFAQWRRPARRLRTLRDAHPLAEAFVEGGGSSPAIHATTISTARQQEGAGFYQTTTTRRRALVDRGGLSRNRRGGRANLNVVSEALATRILFDGQRADRRRILGRR